MNFPEKKFVSFDEFGAMKSDYIACVDAATSRRRYLPCASPDLGLMTDRFDLAK